MTYPLPKDEEARLRTLRDYDILDSGEEKTFDNATFLASAICNTPVSIMALIDRDRQWFKSAYGVPYKTTPRELAFCNYTILQKKPLVVPDLRVDGRYASHGLVINEPHVRFYAGAPLVTPGGFVLGSLCVVDIKPRHLDENQIKALEAEARHVMMQMEHRRLAKSLDKETLHVRKLESLLPLCSHCKCVRNDEEYWKSVENYLSEHPSAAARQGCCKSCGQKPVADPPAPRVSEDCPQPA